MIIPCTANIQVILFALLFAGCGTAKKAKDEIQNILTNAVNALGKTKSEPAPLVLPWKKPNTVIEYIDILNFPDESEITDNHICQCRLEEYQNDSILHSYEGAI